MSTASWEGFTYMWVERGRVDLGGGYIKVGVTDYCPLQSLLFSSSLLLEESLDLEGWEGLGGIAQGK